MPPPRLGLRLRLVALAFLVAGAVSAAGLACAIVAWAALPSVFQRTSPALPALLLVLAAKPGIDAAASRLLGPRGPVAAWLALACGAPPLALAVSLEIVRVFHPGNPWNAPFFDHHAVFPHQLPPTAGAVTVILLGAVPFVAARVIHGAPTRALFPAAAVATGAALLFAGGLLVRAARYPEPDRYEASLPVAGVLPPAGAGPVEDHPLGSLVVRRFVQAGDPPTCTVALVGAGSPLPDRSWFDAKADTCSELEVLRDDAHGVIIVHRRDGARHVTFWDTPGYPPLGREVRSAGMFADRMSLPWTWPVWALPALLAAVAALAAPTRARRLLARRASWRRGAVDEDGHAALDDGSPLAAPAGTRWAVGPLVVIDTGDRAGGAGPFRRAAGAAVRGRVIHEGTEDEVAERLATETAGNVAFALAAAVMAAAPLLGAAVGMW